ncbi:MAG: hypothetical protein AB8C02_00585 [Halioglobus sp.]
MDDSNTPQSGQIQQQRQWPRYFYILVPILVALLTVALIELLLALFWPVPPSMSSNMYYRSDPVTGFAHEPGAVGRYPTGISAVANSRGLRDHEVTLEKPANTRRILMLGDSFTVGVNVEMEDAYPQVLERILNETYNSPVQVINAAVGGTAPFQYAQYFEHYGADYSPDEVMVGLFVGNDVYNQIASVEDIAVVVNGERVSREAAEGRFVQLRIFLHKNFNLIRLLQGVSFATMSAQRQVCDEFSDNLLSIAQVRLNNHSLDFASLPRLRVNAVNQIGRIKRKADEMGIPLTVVLIPDELQISEQLRGRLVTPQDMAKYDFTQPQQLLANDLAALGISTLDLLPFFQADERCLYMNDTHWNPEGNVVAASAIAQYIAVRADKPTTTPIEPSVPRTLSTAAMEMPLDKAVSAIQAFVAIIKQHKTSATHVLDSSLLPQSKDQINAAAVKLHRLAANKKEQDSFVDIARTLAVFQPNVGSTPISINDNRADGTVWLGIVESQRVEIEQSFAAQ